MCRRGDHDANEKSAKDNDIQARLKLYRIFSATSTTKKRETHRMVFALVFFAKQFARKRRLCKMKRFFEIYSSRKESPPNERNQNLGENAKKCQTCPSFSLLICLFSVAFIKRGAVISTQWTGLPSCCCSCSCSCCYAWWWWWWFSFVFQTPGSSSWRTRRGS